MIFITVGTQLAFPRLIDAMDEVAAGLSEPVIAQTGQTGTAWTHLEAHATLPPARFDEFFTNARLIVAHAGIGTILSAKRWGRPLVIVPRRHDLGEHRNDHQLATARQVEAIDGIYVAWDLADLARLTARSDLIPASGQESASHIRLIGRLKTFIDA